MSGLIIDTETFGLTPELGETAFIVGAADPGLKDVQLFELKDPEDIEAFLARVEQAEELIGHNLLFDLRQLIVTLKLKRTHFNRFKWTDTLLLAKHIWPGKWSYGLKQLTAGMHDALQHEDPKKWLRKNAPVGQRHNYSLLPRDILVPYLTNDLIRTAALYKQLEPRRIGCRNQEQLELDHRLMRPVLDMQLKGVKLDTAKLDDLCVAYTQALKEKTDALPFPLLKRSALLDALGDAARSLGFTTPTGQPRVDQEVLTVLAGRNVPLANQILDARLLHKVLSTYVRPWMRYGKIGRLYGSFNIFGASTGRASASNPNLQNIPSEMRTVLVPHGEHVFLVADYNQQEVRAAAYLSGDTGLLSALAGDVHSTTAARVFGVTPNESDEFKMQRKIAKTLLFASMYGARARKIRQTLTRLTKHDWALAECQKIVDAFWSAYPRLRVYSELCQKHAQRGIPLVDPLGRTQYPDKLRPWALLNAMAQGFAAGCTKLAMERVHKAGLDMRLVVHDEIVIQTQKGREVEEAEQLREAMEGAAPGFKFPVEVSVGVVSWGSKMSLKDWKKDATIPVV